MASRFHIHLNAIALDHDTHAALVDLGFVPRPLLDNRPFASQFTPIVHLSFQSADADTFRSVFRQARTTLDQARVAIGYMEGEYVLRERSFTHPSLHSSATVRRLPFAAHLTSKGCAKARTRNERGWNGIRITTPETTEL